MGATQAGNIQIFLGNHSRLLREMLQLALTQFLEHAVIKEINIRDFSPSQMLGEGSRNLKQWVVLTAENEQTPEKRAQALLTQQPNLHVAMLGYDARSLQVYTTQEGGQLHHRTYTDFSLDQLIDIFKGAG
jgi:hypothetical protein